MKTYPSFLIVTFMTENYCLTSIICIYFDIIDKSERTCILLPTILTHITSILLWVVMFNFTRRT